MEHVRVFDVDKSVGFTQEAFLLPDGTVDWRGIHFFIAELEAEIERLKTYQRNARRSARNLQAAYERETHREPKKAVGDVWAAICGIVIGAIVVLVAHPLPLAWVLR